MAMAVTLRGRMLEEAGALEQLMRKIRDDKKDNRDPQDAARTQYESWIGSSRRGGALYKLPPSSGPSAYDFDSGKCDIDAKTENAIRRSAACAEIGDAVVAHERYHRSVCQKLGSTAHADRPAPKIAHEEAAAYELQARQLRDLLALVSTRAGFEFTSVITVDRMRTTTVGHTTGPGRADRGGKDHARVDFPTEVGLSSRGRIPQCRVKVETTPDAGTVSLLITERTTTFSAAPAPLQGIQTLSCKTGSQTIPTPAHSAGFVLKKMLLRNGATVEAKQPPAVIKVKMTCPAP
jgi:hypothetical protein